MKKIEGDSPSRDGGAGGEIEFGIRSGRSRSEAECQKNDDNRLAHGLLIRPRGGKKIVPAGNCTSVSLDFSLYQAVRLIK